MIGTRQGRAELLARRIGRDLVILVAALSFGCSGRDQPSTSASVASGTASPKLATDAAAQTPATPEGMVWVPGGSFLRGDPEFEDARPVRKIHVDGFWMDKYEVTNAQFAKFVAATDYKTVAERPPDPAQFPDAPKELLVPGSIVFTPPDRPVPLDNALQWWRYVPGASWRHPEGPKSSIDGKENYPVVHICYEDAAAYAKWAGKRLPTESEWEFAARGGLEACTYCWGDKLRPDRKWMSNIWQGRFPVSNSKDDGYAATAPVGSFPANGFGLFDMSGNVWEWCSDWYRTDAYESGADRNPQGPSSSHDPQEPGIPKKVQRGGSFMCSDEYCVRYRPGARGKGAVDSAATHVGFRCVQAAKSP